MSINKGQYTLVNEEICRVKNLLEKVAIDRKAVFDVRSHVPCSEDLTKNLDQYVESLRYHGIEGAWHTVTAAAGLEFLVHAAQFNLAFEFDRYASYPDALELSEAFFELFEEPFECWISWWVGSDGKYKSWTPISDSTFDRGVVLVDSFKIGILWFEDED